jgi:hypothetical protein
VASSRSSELARQLESLATSSGEDASTVEDNDGHDYKWFKENRTGARFTNF